jgi:hypothetical protein
MIIFGSDRTLLRTEKYFGKCISCGTANSVSFNLYQKYAKLFYVIPLWPISKVGNSQCSHCKQLLDSTQFDSNYQIEYEGLKSGAKTPIWSFCGLGLIAVFIIVVIVKDKNNTAEDKLLVSGPKAGDVYEIKLNFQEYTLLKVKDVVGDTVFFNTHQYQTNKMSGLLDLKRKGDKGFSEDDISMRKGDLKSMLEKGEILDIER